jgi:hypothetical protein
VNARISRPLLLAVLPVGLASAQQPDFDRDAWLDQQVDQYIERAGISGADRMLWCDPAPNCETIPLKAVDSDSGSATVIVILGGEPTRDQMEFLRKQVDSIRGSGGRVLQAIGPGYEFAVALRSRLSRKEDQ